MGETFFCDRKRAATERVLISKMMSNTSEHLNITGRVWIEEQTDKILVVATQGDSIGFISLFAFVGVLLVFGTVVEIVWPKTANGNVQGADSQKEPIAENNPA